MRACARVGASVVAGLCATHMNVLNILRQIPLYTMCMNGTDIDLCVCARVRVSVCACVCARVCAVCVRRCLH